MKTLPQQSIVSVQQHSDFSDAELLEVVKGFIKEAQLIRLHPGALLFALEYGLTGEAYNDTQHIGEGEDVKETLPPKLFKWATEQGFYGEQKDLWNALTWAISYGIRYTPAEQKDLYASVTGILRESRKVFLDRFPQENEMQAYPVLRSLRVEKYNPHQTH